MSDTPVIESSTNGKNAEPDDPLSVYVLTEFVFCPRAGLCAFKKKEKVEDPEPPLASLDYLPLYDLVEIERALEKSLNEMWLFFLFAIVSGIAGAALTWFVHRDLAFAGLAGILWFGAMTVLRLKDVWVLNGRRREYLNAEPREPDHNSGDRQPVRWCELLRAGYESIRYQEALVDEGLKLGGCPWRVLRRGPLRIPVWVLPRPDGDLHKQHFVRMAAYCHLLEVSEGAESPYGVILFGGCYDGTTIPNGTASRETFRQSLRFARHVIRASRADNPPEAPEQKSVCSGCPHGRPVPCRPGQSEHVALGRPLPVVPAIDANGRSYHSRCGDRFRWLPPHETTIRRQLQLQR